MGIEMTPGD
jgi:hypothetical protein